MKPALKKTCFFAYLALITLLSVMPSSNFPKIPLFAHADKVAHLLMYLVFSFLFLWAWQPINKNTKLLIPLFIVVVWGIFMEIAQKLLSCNRQFEVLDIVANIIGGLCGIGCWLIYTKIKKSLAKNNRFDDNNKL
ncbi:MAG: VanZ family protein [Bacteroidales bacterium]|jgi:VanZ family protein